LLALRQLAALQQLFPVQFRTLVLEHWPELARRS
jgi:hypothetical protein